MLVRLSLLLATLGLALATTACSSLTRPDEIRISREMAAAPAPAPIPAPPPAAPAQAGGHAPGSGG